MVTNRGREIIEQFRKSANMIRVSVGKPVRTDLELVTLEKPRNLLAFAARVNDNRQTFLPDHKAVGSKPRDNGLHGNLLDLDAILFHF